TFPNRPGVIARSITPHGALVTEREAAPNFIGAQHEFFRRERLAGFGVYELAACHQSSQQNTGRDDWPLAASSGHHFIGSFGGDPVCFDTSRAIVRSPPDSSLTHPLRVSGRFHPPHDLTGGHAVSIVADRRCGQDRADNIGLDHTRKSIIRRPALKVRSLTPTIPPIPGQAASPWSGKNNEINLQPYSLKPSLIQAAG
ncbi:MAG: hypothetical protein KAX36_10905, partial [Thermoflexales bacterium]|nr:hypothetical protein [Thermoflexales bacterium]